MDAVSYIDVYKISGNPIDLDERRNWLRENSCWLNEYGIDANGFDTLEGEDFLVSRPSRYLPVLGKKLTRQTPLSINFEILFAGISKNFSGTEIWPLSI